MSDQVDGVFRAFLAGEALEAWRRVKYNGSNQVVHADADDAAIGITQEKQATSGLPVNVKLLHRGATFKVQAAGAFSDGDELYGADDGMVDDAVTGGKHQLKALAAASGANSIVEAICVDDGDGLLYAAIADSAEVENTTDETAFDKSKTIDGGELKVGDVLEIIARAYVLDNNSTDELTLKLKCGTEVIVSTGAVDVADGDIGFIHAFVTVRAVGASGKLSASGVVGLGVEGTVTAKPFRKDEASEDLSGDVAITVTATWSVAHADNEVYLEDLIVIKHRQ